MGRLAVKVRRAFSFCTAGENSVLERTGESSSTNALIKAHREIQKSFK